MARVPKVESPCPIAGKQLPAGASEHCGLCDRSVHNLNLMNADERHEFMRSCSGKVCVAYTVRMPIRRRGLATATLALASLAGLPAAADVPAEPPAGAMSPADPGALPNCDDYYDVVVTGGVSRGRDAEWVDDGKDAPPELPTIEDDGR